MKILLRGVKQLLTLHGPARPRRGPEMSELGIIPDGALLISDSQVEQAGPRRRIENLEAAHGALPIDAGGRVVTPGLVDSHTHLIYGVLGPYGHDAVGDRAGVIRQLRLASALRLEAGARAIIEGMVRHGTTTLEAKCGYEPGISPDTKLLRAIAGLNGSPVEIAATYLAQPAAQEPRPPREIERLCSLLPKIKRRGHARFADIICDGGAFSAEDARRYLEEARGLGFLLKVHADELLRGGGVRLAIEMGAVSVDHLDRADADDIAALAQSDTIATLLPGSGVPACGGAAARELIDRGAAVALGTNYHARTGLAYSMQMALSLACSQLKMTEAEVLTAATVNGAHALRRGDKIGSLERGKQANLVLWNVSDYREIARAFGVNLAHQVMVRGAVVYQEGRVRRSAVSPNLNQPPRLT